MKITMFVNSMVLIEGESTRILCDPWVTFNNKSSSGMYNFPKLDVNEQQIADIKPDFIYITHGHADHYDEYTLSLFDKNTPVLIADYTFNYLEKNLRKLGFSDVRISHSNKPIPLNGGDWIRIWKGTLYPEVDSVSLCNIDDQTIVNINDNPWDSSYADSLKHQSEHIDVALIPYGGYGPYPRCYDNLSETERKEIHSSKVLKGYQDFTNWVKMLSPDYAVPFAGGVITYGEGAPAHEFAGLGTKDGCIEYALESQDFTPIKLSQHMVFDSRSGTISGEFNEVAPTRSSAYVQEMLRTKGPFDEGGIFYIAPENTIDLSRILEVARKRQLKYQVQRGVVSEVVVYFDVGQDRLYRLDMKEDSVGRCLRSDITDNEYEIFRMPYSFLLAMLTNHVKFDNLKSANTRFYRKPNVYWPEIHQLLNFLHI